jgi:hypothetical protein
LSTLFLYTIIYFHTSNINSDEQYPKEKELGIENEYKPKKEKILLNKIFKLLSQRKNIYIVSLVLIIIISTVLYNIIPAPEKKDPVEQAKLEASMIKKELSKHIILPKDDQIDIRKITEKIEDPFFEAAEIGDYLIILYKNRIAYIYSIDKDIIVNAGVVFIDPKTATTTNNLKTQ